MQVGSTGSTSVGKLLKAQYGGVDYPYEEHIIPQTGIKINTLKHLTIDEMLARNDVTRQELDGYLKFASIRNPYDYYVARYSKYRLRKYSGSAIRGEILKKNPDFDFDKHAQEVDQKDFERWLRNHLGFRRTLKDLARVLTGKKRLAQPLYRQMEGTDMVVKNENLVEDLNKVLARVGAPPAETVRNTNPGVRKRDYRIYYNPYAKRIVLRNHAEFMEAHGYTF